MSNEVQEVKIKNNTNISLVFWIAGYLFTCGMLDIKGLEEILAAFFSWPLILGDFLGNILRAVL